MSAAGRSPPPPPPGPTPKNIPVSGAHWRRPQVPGHLGALQWRPGLVGVGILGAGSVLATQFMAWRLEYQDALGGAWLNFGRHAVYLPWQGLEWLARFGWDPNPYVRNTLLGAIGIEAGAMFAAVAAAMLLLDRRPRRLSQDQDHLHGSARFATRADLVAQGLLADRQGVVIGAWQEPGFSELEYLTDHGTSHVLAFAPTRSGKGVGLVIPSLLTWPGSAIVYDIKGENWQLMAGFRA